ncbi:hypothetical protein BCD48_26660 [Pseudofrankia sp. BMG5.36]|nr:hypothetical protein BCD48_26660 [Pseudofrankia sp. BMG5.36]
MTDMAWLCPRAERRVGTHAETLGELVMGTVSLRRAIQASPGLFDAVLAAMVAILSMVPVAVGALGRGPSIQDAVAAGVTFLLLVGRHRAPLTVLVLALLVAATSIVAAPTTMHLLEATALIALYTVTAINRRWRAIAATAVASVALYAANAYVAGSVISGDSVGVVAFVGMAAAIGVSVRTWRDNVAAADERADRAEATRDEEARRRVAEERLRIARELHDVIAHHIAVINVQAGVASHLVRTQPSKAEVTLSQIREAGRTVLDELGAVLYVLRQSDDDAMPTEPLPGLSRLGQLLESFTAAGFRIQQQTTGKPRTLAIATDLAAYRIIQEGLTNAHKHGPEPHASLLLEYRPDAITITIRNLLSGTHNASAGTGHGLIGMRERAQAAGGTLDVGPEPGGRFRLHACLPLPGPQGSGDEAVKPDVAGSRNAEPERGRGLRHARTAQC